MARVQRGRLFSNERSIVFSYVLEIVSRNKITVRLNVDAFAKDKSAYLQIGRMKIVRASRWASVEMSF